MDVIHAQKKIKYDSVFTTDQKKTMLADFEAFVGSLPKSLTPTEKTILYYVKVLRCPINDVAELFKQYPQATRRHYKNAVVKLQKEGYECL